MPGLGYLQCLGYHSPLCQVILILVHQSLRTGHNHVHLAVHAPAGLAALNGTVHGPCAGAQHPGTSHHLHDRRIYRCPEHLPAGLPGTYNHQPPLCIAVAMLPWSSSMVSIMEYALYRGIAVLNKICQFIVLHVAVLEPGHPLCTYHPAPPPARLPAQRLLPTAITAASDKAMKPFRLFIFICPTSLPFFNRPNWRL